MWERLGESHGPVPEELLKKDWLTNNPEELINKVKERLNSVTVNYCKLSTYVTDYEEGNSNFEKIWTSIRDDVWIKSKAQGIVMKAKILHEKWCENGYLNSTQKNLTVFLAEVFQLSNCIVPEIEVTY